MTKRQAILYAILDGLVAEPELHAELGRVSPVSRSETCVAILIPEAETVEFLTTDSNRHELDVLVRVLVSDPADYATAENYVELAHNAFLTGATSSGLVDWTVDTGTVWNFEPGDSTVLGVDLRFRVVYSTAPAALS